MFKLESDFGQSVAPPNRLMSRTGAGLTVSFGSHSRRSDRPATAVLFTNSKMKSRNES
jgi:hypothetical protein